jgi:hypothetical protein
LDIPLDDEGVFAPSHRRRDPSQPGQGQEKTMSFIISAKKFFGIGNWYVLYPDGRKSRPMCCRVAKSYSRIFGGTIHPTSKPIFDLGLRR